MIDLLAIVGLVLFIIVVAKVVFCEEETEHDRVGPWKKTFTRRTETVNFVSGDSKTITFDTKSTDHNGQTTYSKYTEEVSGRSLRAYGSHVTIKKMATERVLEVQERNVESREPGDSKDMEYIIDGRATVIERKGYSSLRVHEQSDPRIEEVDS